MTLEMIVVFALLAVAVVLFATEKLSVDLVALIVMTTLLLIGIITPREGLAGFSNTATVTVGAMFILSAALFKTGAVNSAGRLLSQLGKRSFWLTLAAVMLITGFVSAFINNTAAVAIFLPVMLGVARNINVSASKLLMPLSFAGMFGGVCTLIGTSTNILINALAERRGQPPFEMFDFAPLGLILFAVGTIYMLTIGVRLIPDRRSGADLTQDFRMDDYLTDIVLLPESASVGKTLAESPLIKELEIAVLEIHRQDEKISVPTPQTTLEANDILRVRANVAKINELQEHAGVKLKPGIKWREADLESEQVALVEAVVSLDSPLMGKTLEGARFRSMFGATVLAIRHRGDLVRENFSNIPLRAGDALLVEVKRDRLEQLRQDKAFVITSEVGLPEFRRSKIIPAFLIILFVVASAALNFLPIVVSAITGCVLMVLTRCISLDEAYKAIEWRIIFLLAGVLTLGVALEKTGAARLLSEAMLSSIGVWGAVALVSAFYLLTSILTEMMSNNATAALLAPVAIVTAESLGVSPRPFLVAVAFAASASFMTPIGYQTNTLIYGPGGYRFIDFVKVGTPLNIIFWILATLLIPYFFPF